MKPLDMVVASKLVSVAITGITYQGLTEALGGIGAADAHRSAKRLVQSGLFKEQGRQVPYPRRQALLEFWVHGLKYVFPAQRGAPTRGLPTSVGAAPLAHLFPAPEGGAPVWPSPTGTARGPALLPVHASALQAGADRRVYELLALLDALREGRAREQAMAAEELKNRLYSWC